MTNDLSGFIIPMKVLAYRVQNGTKKVPALNPNYKTARVYALGNDFSPDAFNTRIELQEGVHLHFILPSVLKHGTEFKDENGNKTTIHYPYVPDKFIVTRMYVANGQIINDCNIVDSRFVSTESNGNNITIPFFEDNEMPYRYLGRQYSGFKEPAPLNSDQKEGYIEKLYGVGPGDPMFNAYYPNCQGVFGYHDNLEGVPDDAVLTYSVIGCYSDPAKDFFAETTPEKLKDFLSDHNLTAENYENFKDFNKCLVFGEVCGIDLSKKNPLPTGEINVGIAKTTAEALSAVIAQKYPSNKIDERTLTALQYDMTDEISQIDGNFKIDDGIHSYGFTTTDPMETTYDIIFPKDVKYKNPSKNQDPSEPSNVLNVYTALCDYKHQYGIVRRLLEFKKKALYHLWEMYMKSNEPLLSPGPIAKKINEIIGEINLFRDPKPTGHDQYKLAIIESNINKSLNDLKTTIANTVENPEIVTIQEVPTKPFYYPKDPAVMFFGTGMKRIYAFEDSTKDNPLLCLTSPLTNEDADKIKDLISKLIFNSEIDRDSYLKYLIMTVMLDQNLLNALGISLSITEKYSPIMVNTKPYDEELLFMEWMSKFHNNYTDSKPTSSLQHGDTDYVYTGEKNERGRWSLGTSVLTPHGVCNLSDKINRFIKKHPNLPWDGDLKELEKNIREIPAISQNMAGFTINLSSLKYVFQKTMNDNRLLKDDVTEKVYKCLYEERRSYETTPERFSIVYNSDVIPLREGFLDLDKLSIVSTFGNVRPVFSSDEKISEYRQYISENICRSAYTLDACKPNTLNECFLPLALTTPARLTSYFISKKIESTKSSSLSGTSPIIAIIMPDMLNRNLDIFDSTGELLGVIKRIYKKGEESTQQVETGSFSTINKDYLVKDKRTVKFIDILTNDDSCSFTKGRSYLSELMNLIDAKLNKTISMDKNDFIFGRILVLAQMRIELEYLGGTEFSKTDEAIANLDDKGLSAQEFPVMIGDIDRVSDGVICGFYGDKDKTQGGLVADDFKNCFATFGYDTQNNEFIKAAPPTVSGKDKVPQKITLLLDPSLMVTLSTGFLPVEQIQINAKHTDFSRMNLKYAEMNTLISEEEKILLPDFTNGKHFTRKYPIQKDKSAKNESIKYKDIEVVNNLHTSSITKTIITDGFIAKTYRESILTKQTNK